MKSPADMTQASIDFIALASGVGIDFIKNNQADPNFHAKLHRIFLDIQEEATGEQPDRMTGPRPEVYCSQCKPGPNYAYCITHCTPGADDAA